MYYDVVACDRADSDPRDCSVALVGFVVTSLQHDIPGHMEVLSNPVLNAFNVSHSVAFTDFKLLMFQPPSTNSIFSPTDVRLRIAT